MDSPGQTRRNKVLFVCIGNTCRSQMAEAVARHLYSDVIEAESAGTAPMGSVATGTLAVLQEMGISAEGQYSKGVEDALAFFAPEIVVDMAGRTTDGMFPGARLLRWEIDDAYGTDAEAYRRVLADIELHVKKLADELRRANLP